MREDRRAPAQKEVAAHNGRGGLTNCRPNQRIPETQKPAQMAGFVVCIAEWVKYPVWRYFCKRSFYLLRFFTFVPLYLLPFAYKASRPLNVRILSQSSADLLM